MPPFTTTPGDRCDPRGQGVATWMVVISGYTQHEGRMSGLMRLWLALNREHSSPSCRVELEPWNANWSQIAEKIWLVWQNGSDKPPRIFIAGYSWGAGWGFVQLSKELAKRGLAVDVAVLSDPVYRHRYWLGQWRAFWPFSKIVVPRNVRRVVWMYQTNNLPRGHKLVAESRKTQIASGIRIFADHAYMDDAPVFHERALEAARDAA